MTCRRLPILLLLGVWLLACADTATPQRSVAPATRSPAAPTGPPAPAATPLKEPTPDLSALVPTKHLIVCLPSEPETLWWMSDDPAARVVLDALTEPLIDSRYYDHQPNLVEKLPSFEDGDAVIKEVLIGEGNRFFDALSQQPLVLTTGMTQTVGLYQLDGNVRLVEQWDGQPLPTVQMTAQWTLLEGLTWEDGMPVTTQDLLFSFEKMNAPDWPGPTDLRERTRSYTALDERTLVWEGLPGYIDSTYFLNIPPPVPEHRYHRLFSMPPLLTLAGRQPISYGPYRIQRWINGVEIDLVPNPHYVRGQPPLDRLTFRFVADPNDLLDQLLIGACDVATHRADWPTIYDRLASLVQQKRLKMQKEPTRTFEHLDFNLRPVEGYAGAAATLRDAEGNLLFQNPTFRHAVALCLDREALVEELANDAAFVRHSYVSPDHLLYPGNGALTLYPFRPMDGRAMLETLGWADRDGDGIVEDAAGNRLVVRYAIRDTPQRAQVAALVKEQLRLYCGIDAQIEAYGADFFADGPTGLVFGRQYDLAQFGWQPDVEPPCYLYLSEEIPVPENGWQGGNNVGFAHPEFDAACRTALETLDEDVKASAHAQALAIFTRELPSIPLYSDARIVVYRPEIKGVVLDPTASSDLWNVEHFDVRR